MPAMFLSNSVCKQFTETGHTWKLCLWYCYYEMPIPFGKKDFYLNWPYTHLWDLILLYLGCQLDSWGRQASGMLQSLPWKRKHPTLTCYPLIFLKTIPLAESKKNLCWTSQESWLTARGMVGRVRKSCF